MHTCTDANPERRPPACMILDALENTRKPESSAMDLTQVRYLHACVHKHTHTHISTKGLTQVKYVYVFKYVYKYVYVFKYVYKYVYVFKYVYKYVYVFTYLRKCLCLWLYASLI
jgi:hypothetical protein